MATRGDLEATKRVMLEQMRQLYADHYAWGQEREVAQKRVQQADTEQGNIRDRAERLNSVGIGMGFDLYALLNEEAVGAQSEAPPVHTITHPPVPLRIKDYILEQVEAAYPKPLRAADLRERIKNLGQEIHSKTIGMSLYRWSQKHVIRRDGLDWYFVPEADRPTEEDIALERELLDAHGS